MKVCIYNGLVIAILTRNEHCPPHVHVGPQEWDARFEFSFWHNGVRLWDVEPVQNRPTDRLLEAIRQEIKKPEHHRLAREELIFQQGEIRDILSMGLAAAQAEDQE